MRYRILPWAEHLAAEAEAIRALKAAGFEVGRNGEGVVIRGPGFTLHARVARAVVADVLPDGALDARRWAA